MDRDLAGRRCEELTRAQAANFYYGIRLLPAEKRRAMCAVYAYARLVDDIGDGPLQPSEKQRQLDAVRFGLGAETGPGADPTMSALADARQRFDLPTDALFDLVDGVQMDLDGSTYESFPELVIYCRRVAGSIGRLCLAIFGSSDRERALALSDDLGVALQLTNILRDVREDLSLGRVYLPADDLRRFSCEELAAAEPNAVAELIRFEADRAREWFARGLGLLELLDRRSAASAAAMSGIYLRLLTRIEARPEAVLCERVSLHPWQKAWVAASSLVRTA